MLTILSCFEGGLFGLTGQMTQYNMEFELRLQQYIEMIRSGDKSKLVEAMVHAKKYLTPYAETQSTEIHRAAGLLAFPGDTKAEPYKVRHVISPERMKGKMRL